MPSLNLTALGFGDYVSIRRWNKRTTPCWFDCTTCQCVSPCPCPLSSHLATKNLSGGFEILVQLIAQLAMWLRLRLSAQPAVGIKVSPCGLSYGGSHVQWKYIDTKEIRNEPKYVCDRNDQLWINSNNDLNNSSLMPRTFLWFEQSETASRGTIEQRDVSYFMAKNLPRSAGNRMWIHKVFSTHEQRQFPWSTEEQRTEPSSVTAPLFTPAPELDAASSNPYTPYCQSSATQTISANTRKNK